ncbi:hypothetical protein ACROYT_G020440 [Oculina patagonica]
MENRYDQPQTSESKHSELHTGSIPRNHSKTFIDFVMRVRRRVRQVPLVFCLMILTSFFQAGQSVWSLSIPHQVYIVSTVSQFCRGMDLTPAQTEFCFRNRELMASIRDGASLAIKQCHYQFQYRRWNCSVPERDSNTLFRRITGKGTREAAFTYAIASAGVAHSIARACVGGNLSLCGCSRERRPEGLEKEYQWGGCGDNIEAGAKYAKEFLNAGEESVSKEKDTSKLERTLMNLHNNEVGIQVVKDNFVIRCKCHGVSTSCGMKTCWKEIVQFRNIGDILLQKYDGASKVRYDRRTGRILKLTRSENGFKRAGKRRSASSRPATGNLVYLERSPNYCVKSRREKTLGTEGRECKADIEGHGSCDMLCCGRGFRPTEFVVREKCQCKFKWCCWVECKECVVTEEAKILCKCHGLSGSCNIKTCSRHIAEFRVIGEVLHQKYDNALRVKMEKAKTDDKNVLHVLKKRKNGGYRRDNGKLRSTKQQPKTSALVFLKDSPNFCVKSSRHEFPGTVGRICSTDSYGSDSCHGDNLCCGRGYRSERVQTIHRCKCKFHWCCEIRCKRCEKVETRNTCR